MTRPTDSVTLPLPQPDQRWLHLLKQAVRDDPRGCTGVALKLIKPPESISSVGKTYHRSYVSQAVNGLLKQPAGVLFQQAVLAAFGDGRIDCPHLKTDIALGECQRHSAITWGQVANTGYERLDLWRACQDCLHNPANQSNKAKP